MQKSTIMTKKKILFLLLLTSTLTFCAKTDPCIATSCTFFLSLRKERGGMRQKKRQHGPSELFIFCYGHHDDLSRSSCWWLGGGDVVAIDGPALLDSMRWKAFLADDSVCELPPPAVAYCSEGARSEEEERHNTGGGERRSDSLVDGIDKECEGTAATESSISSFVVAIFFLFWFCLASGDTHIKQAAGVL